MSEPKLKVSIDLLIQAYPRIPRVGGGRYRRKASVGGQSLALTYCKLDLS